jgi:hypothetical protein
LGYGGEKKRTETSFHSHPELWECVVGRQTGIRKNKIKTYTCLVFFFPVDVFKMSAIVSLRDFKTVERWGVDK